MSKPPKIDRKTLKTPDKFVLKGRAALDAMAGHRPFLFSLIGVVVVAVLGYYGYLYMADRQQDAAWKTYEETNKLPEAERWEKLKAAYTGLIQSRPKFLTAITLADHYFDEAKKEALKAGGDPSKNAQQSVEWYTKALDYSGLYPVEKQLVLVNRGNSREILKKVDEALADYRKASEISGEAKGLALIGIGRAFELKKDPAKAMEAYEKVTIEMGGSEFGKMAKNYLRRLKSPLFKADPSKG